MTKKPFIEWNLQLFADNDNADPTNTGSNDNNANEDENSITESQLKQRLARQKAAFDKQLAEELEKARKEAVQAYIDQQEEDKKFQNLSKSDKLQAQIDKLNKENQQLKDWKQFESMKATARQLLSDEGLNVPDSVLAFTVTKTADETKENIAALKEWADVLKAEWEKSRATGNTPQGNTSAGNTNGTDPFAELLKRYK